MATKDKGKDHQKHSSSSYPKDWSAWVLRVPHQANYRAREISKGTGIFASLWKTSNFREGEYEYEFDWGALKDTSSSTPVTQSNSLAPMLENNASQFSSYTLQTPSTQNDPISTMTPDMASYSLSAKSQNSSQSASPQQARVTTENPSTTKEKFDPSKVLLWSADKCPI